MVKHQQEPFDKFQQYYKTQEEIVMTPRESFKKFVWNSKEKEFCGRNAESWGKSYFLLLCLTHTQSGSGLVCLYFLLLNCIPTNPYNYKERSVYLCLLLSSQGVRSGICKLKRFTFKQSAEPWSNVSV